MKENSQCYKMCPQIAEDEPLKSVLGQVSGRLKKDGSPLPTRHFVVLSTFHELFFFFLKLKNRLTYPSLLFNLFPLKNNLFLSLCLLLLLREQKVMKGKPPQRR